MAKEATILLLAGLISVSAARLAAAQHTSLEICLRSDAHVADDTLEEARRVVSNIYSQAGLTLRWCADDCRITIVLRPRASDDTARRAKDAMGRIMKASLNQSDFRKVRQGELSFTAEQARLIQNSISALTVSALVSKQNRRICFIRILMEKSRLGSAIPFSYSRTSCEPDPLARQRNDGVGIGSWVGVAAARSRAQAADTQRLTAREA